MSSYTLWHNPGCSKCRETLALFESRGLAPDVVCYLETPPPAEEIERVLDLLGVPPRALMRTKEPLYAELGLDDQSLSREALVAAMAAHPILIERPVVIRDGKEAVIGRPVERVVQLLGRV